MIFSVVLLVLGWAMGAVFFWDVRGIATSIRERPSSEIIATLPDRRTRRHGRNPIGMLAARTGAPSVFS